MPVKLRLGFLIHEPSYYEFTCKGYINGRRIVFMRRLCLLCELLFLFLQ